MNEGSDPPTAPSRAGFDSPSRGAGPPADVAGLHVTAVGEEQVFLVAAAEAGPDPGKAARPCYADVAAFLRDRGMEIVHERIFGSLSAESAVMSGRSRALGAIGIVAEDIPVTYIEGHPPWGDGFAGALVHAVATREGESEVTTIRDGGVPCGRRWRNGDTTFLFLHDMNGTTDDPGASPSRPDQTRRTIERAERILREQGATYRDVIRTWFYLNDILDWYDDFNAARSGKYDEIGIMPREGLEQIPLPASTGISGVAPHRSAEAVDLIAAIGAEGVRPRIKQLSNEGQKDAFRYGSAFSRGALIREKDADVIQLSGTASIDETGATVYVGDPVAQIDCTLDKIEALLSQEGARLRDICSATAFVKEPEYAELFWKAIADRGLDGFPAVCVVADVCRHDLLFEMDGEVVFDRGDRD